MRVCGMVGVVGVVWVWVVWFGGGKGEGGRMMPTAAVEAHTQNIPRAVCARTVSPKKHKKKMHAKARHSRGAVTIKPLQSFASWT